MSTTFNCKAIMQAAHFVAKWRVLNVGGSYRVWFSKALANEWKKAKATRTRQEQNLGLPIRSCFADAPALADRQLYTRQTGWLAGQFAA